MVLLLNISMVLGFALFVLAKVNRNLNALWGKVRKILLKNSLKAAFVFSALATGGSLYFSEVAELTPCKLCWYQRIFMYPLPFILAAALWQKARDVRKYVLPLSIIGFLLAGYHYYLQVTPAPLSSCSSVGFSVSCSERFVTNFGYITIPWMSLSAFAFIIIAMLHVRKSKVT